MLAALIQATAIGLVATALFYQANQTLNAASWAEHLHLSAKPKSRIQALNICRVPPFCMQGILALADFHNSPLIQVHHRLICNIDAIDPNAPNSEVFILDPSAEEPSEEVTEYARNNPDATYPPAHLRTHVPTEETQNRVEDRNALSLIFLVIRRLPKGYKGGVADAAESVLGVVVDML